MQRGLYFEDFEVDATFVTGSHEITAAEIAQFAALTGDDNPLHLDRAFAQTAGFHDVIAHGFLIQSIVMGLIADTGIMRGTTIALVGAELRFVAPAVAGTQIRAEVRISGKRLSSNKRGGVLQRSVNVVDQNGTTLVAAELTNVMKLKPATDSLVTAEGAA